MLKKGIILIATGNPYYGRMAYNLALTIKRQEPQMPIHCVFSIPALNHLSNEQLRIFEELIVLPRHIKPGISVKTHLYDLSLFDETLYLDVDMAWFPKRKPSDLFMEVQDSPFTCITEGFFHIEKPEYSSIGKNYYHWADPRKICEAYGLTQGKLYQTRSEVIHFRKCDKVAALFESAKEVYESPKVENIQLFNGQVPDELAFNIAMAIHDIHPHQYKWKPSLWTKIHKEPMFEIDALYSKYYLLSCGSNYSTMQTKKVYDRVVKTACIHFKVQHLFPLFSKEDFIRHHNI